MPARTARRRLRRPYIMVQSATIATTIAAAERVMITAAVRLLTHRIVRPPAAVSQYSNVYCRYPFGWLG
jgi:hypothetical protein